MKNTWRCDGCGLEWRRESGSTATCVDLERAEERAEKATARVAELEQLVALVRRRCREADPQWAPELREALRRIDAEGEPK